MQKIIFIGIFVLFLAPFFALAQTATPCNQFQSGSAPPQGYGAAWNPFDNGRELWVRATCTTSGAPVTYAIGTQNERHYAYKTGYFFDGAWKPFTLTGTFVQGSTEWLSRNGTYTHATPPASDHFFVGYICRWDAGATKWTCGCRDSACTTSFWQLQQVKYPVVGGSTAGSTTSGSAVGTGAVPSQCSGTWRVAARDTYGWLNPPQGNTWFDSDKRFSKSTAPDGTPAILHLIKKGAVIAPITYDTRVLYSKAGYCAAMLRFKMYNEAGKWRTWPGKYMAIMVGKDGKHSPGGSNENPIGGRHYTTSPVVSGTDGTVGAKNGFRGFVGSENREALGASCDGNRCYEIGYGNAPVIATGRWITVELVVVMNAKNQSNGEAYYTLDGKKYGPLKGVAWTIDPATAPDVWARWEMMYGGNPEDMPPPYDLKEWYTDFELLIAE